jgi:hypothetical protein
MTVAVKSSLKIAKNSVKKTKSSPKTRKSSEPPPSDITQVKEVAKLLLGRLEINIRNRSPLNPKKPKEGTDEKTIAEIEKKKKEKEDQQKKQYETIFGKRPCLDNLVTLADMMMKLEKAEAPTVPATLDNPTPSEELKMNDADLALVEHFVERVRGREDA